MRVVACFFLCLCFIVNTPALALDEIVAEVEPFVDYAQPYTRDMSLGNSGEDVAFMQHRLYGLGYLTGAVDGEYGSDTEKAVRDFQSAHASLGLTPTGAADKATLNALMSDGVLSALLKAGDKGDDVRRLQNALIEYGYLSDKADGSYGKLTSSAVADLQRHIKAQGLEGYGEDGNASALFQSLLYSGNYNPYIRDLSLSDTGVEVGVLSGRLNSLGYMDIKTDEFNGYLKDALSDFQRENGLNATGVADFDTFGALFSSNAVKAARYTRRNLSYSDRGDTVTQLQWALMVNGFMSGYTTGEFDDRTADALENLKEYWDGYSDDETTRISADTQNRLLNGEAPKFKTIVRKSDKGDEVKRVQRRLSTLFYIYVSDVDGVAGSKFESAILRFQAENGLDQTGIADEQTQNVLFSNDAISLGSKYILRVSTNDQLVYVYERETNGRYELIKSMVCSTGLPGTPTPNGVYQAYTRRQDRWHYFTEFACWAQYTFIISGNILFHSVLFNARSESSTRYSSVNNLGRPASHGCVRLAVEDAKWIFENCEANTVVIVHP